MVFRFDGCSFYYAHIEVNQVFRFVKSDFYFEDLFYFTRAQNVLSYHLDERKDEMRIRIPVQKLPNLF